MTLTHQSTNLAEFLFNRIELSSDTNQSFLSDGNTYVKQKDLIKIVSDRVQYFSSLGITAGDHIVLLFDQGISFWLDLMATWSMGAIGICLESDPENAHANNVKELTSAKFIGCGDKTVPDCFSSFTKLDSIRLSPKSNQKGRPRKPRLPFVKIESGQTAAIIFTSGSTGLPKGVPLSHENLRDNALATSEVVGLTQQHILMIATPYRFISSISHFLVSLLARSSFIGIERKLLIGDLIKLLQEQNVTAFGGSPFHTQFIAKAGEKRLPNLKWLMSSGDHLRAEHELLLKQNFKDIDIYVVYGMAELGGRFCIRKSKNEVNIGSVGKPIKGLKLEVVSDEGELCSPNTIGRIIVKGRLVFSNYLGKGPLTEVLERSFDTGDLGFINDEEYVFINGRSDSVFKRSGLKVSTKVIEDAFIRINCAEECFVEAVDDELEGKVPVVYLSGIKVLTQMHSIISELRRILPPNNLPKRIWVVKGLPRTGSGKVDRRSLHVADKNKLF